MKVLVMSDRPVVGDAITAVVSEAMPNAVVERLSPTSMPFVNGSHRPDIAVIDASGTSERLRLAKRLQDTGIEVVALIDEPNETLRLLRSGTAGVVTPQQELSGVLEAVRTVLSGHTHVPAPLVGDVLKELIELKRRSSLRRSRIERLSPRELEVLSLLGDGSDQRTIARTLAISSETAKTHIRNIRQKLGVRTRVEAAALAADMAPLPLGPEPTARTDAFDGDGSARW